MTRESESGDARLYQRRRQRVAENRKRRLQANRRLRLRQQPEVGTASALGEEPLLAKYDAAIEPFSPVRVMKPAEKLFATARQKRSPVACFGSCRPRK